MTKGEKSKVTQMQAVYDMYTVGERLPLISLEWEAERAISILGSQPFNPQVATIQASKAIGFLMAYGYSFVTSCLIIDKWLKIVCPTLTYTQVVKNIKGVQQC